MDKRREANRIVREKICTAMFQLLGEKPFPEITVTDLVRRAQVARASYYRNFSSKEDVVRTQLSATLTAAAAQLRGRRNLTDYETVLGFWRYFSGKRDICAALCTGALSELLLDTLNRLDLHMGQTPAEGDSGYYLSGYIGALYNLLRKWIRGGCQESPEHMASIFCRMFGSPSPA